MGKTCSRLVLVVALWCLLSCPHSSSFLFERRSLTVLHSNVRCSHGAYYIAEGSVLNYTCSFTEHYTGKKNCSLIKPVYTTSSVKEYFQNNTEEVCFNETIKLMTVRDVPFTDVRGINIKCSVQPGHNGFSVTENFVVFRKLKPVRFTVSDCSVSLTNMTCKWKPTIEEQRSHTGVPGHGIEITVEQFVCWHKRQNDKYIPSGGNITNVCGNWNQTKIHEGSSIWNMTHDFEMGAVYDIEVHFTDLADNIESEKDVVINTTERVKISSVSNVQATPLSSTELQLNWTLPSLPAEHQQLLDVRVECNSEWEPKVTVKPVNITPNSNSSDEYRKSYQLTELDPYTKYTCDVSVKTQPSDVWSDKKHVQGITKSDRPVVNPDYLPVTFMLVPATGKCKSRCLSANKSCIGDSCRELTVFWELLHRRNYHCPDNDFKYLIQYRLKSLGTSSGSYSNWTNDSSQSSDISQWTASVSRDTEVQIRILSHNNIGTAEPEEDGVVMEISPQGLVSVSNMVVESDNSENVSISWKSNEPKKYSSWFLLICENSMKIAEHKCSGQLHWLDVTADVDSSGRGLHETTVSRLTASLTTKKRRRRRSAKLLLGEILLGIVGQTNEISGSQGITWPDFYYLNTEVPEKPTLKFKKCQHYTMCPTWTYICDHLCSRPDTFELLYKKTDSNSWRSKTVGGTSSQTTVEDLDSDSTYVVKIVVFSASGKRSYSEEKTDKITGPILTPGAIAGIVMASLLIIAVVMVILMRKCCKCRKHWHDLKIQLPGDFDTRRYLDSSSSRNPVLQSQSSSEPGRHYSSQLSDDSRTVLIPSSGNHRQHGSGDLLPHSEEDDVFTDDQPSFNAHNYAHSNGKTKENIPLTPITLQPKDQEPNVFRIQDFQTIQSEYLHPETEEDKRLVEEDQEIEYHENMEAYCRVCVPSGRRYPVERDDREGSYPREMCACKETVAMETKDTIATEVDWDAKKLEDQAEGIKNQPEGQKFLQPLVVNLSTKKQPTEDYWKDSGDSVNHFFEKEKTPEKLGLDNWGQGSTDPFFNFSKNDLQHKALNDSDCMRSVDIKKPDFIKAGLKVDLSKGGQENTDVEKPWKIDSEKSDFPKTDFKRADFQKEDREKPSLHKAEVEKPPDNGGNLEKPLSNETLMERLDFCKTDFMKPDFHDADSRKPDFCEADSGKPDFHEIDSRKPDFHEADVQKAGFNRATLEKPGFHKAGVSKSHGCISSLLPQPNGYVSISEGNIGGLVESSPNTESVSRKPRDLTNINNDSSTTSHKALDIPRLQALAKREYVSQEELAAVTQVGALSLNTPVSGNSQETCETADMKGNDVTTNGNNFVTLTDGNTASSDNHSKESGSPEQKHFELTKIPSPRYNVENPRILFSGDSEKVTEPELPKALLQKAEIKNDVTDSMGKALLESIALSTKALKESLKQPRNEETKSSAMVIKPNDGKSPYSSKTDQLIRGKSQNSQLNYPTKYSPALPPPAACGKPKSENHFHGNELVGPTVDKKVPKTSHHRSHASCKVPTESSEIPSVPSQINPEEYSNHYFAPAEKTASDSDMNSSLMDFQNQETRCPSHLKPSFKDLVVDNDVDLPSMDSVLDTDIVHYSDSLLPSTTQESDVEYCQTDLTVDLSRCTPENDTSPGVMNECSTPLLEEDVLKLKLIDTLEHHDSRDESHGNEDGEGLRYCATNLKKEAAILGQVREVLEAENRRNSDDEDRFYVSTSLTYDVA